MKKTFIYLLFIVFVCVPVLSKTSDHIVIKNGYVRMLPPSVPNTGGYMEILNQDKVDHYVIRAESQISSMTELHTHDKVGESFQMRAIEKIKVPAKSKVVLKPGGTHIMMMGLKKSLNQNHKVNLNLYFEDGSVQKLVLPILKK